jgi:hypothetical protein
MRGASPMGSESCWRGNRIRVGVTAIGRRCTTPAGRAHWSLNAQHSAPSSRPVTLNGKPG